MEMMKPESVAKLMRQRYFFYRDTYNSEIPDFVPEHYFIIGSDENEKAHAYVIVKEIKRNLKFPNAVWNDLYRVYSDDRPDTEAQEEKEKITSFLREALPTVDARQKFKTHARKFCEITRRNIEVHQRAIDIHNFTWDNMLLLDDGSLRYIDTDKIWEIGEMNPSRKAKTLKGYKDFLTAFEEISNEL